MLLFKIYVRLLLFDTLIYITHIYSYFKSYLTNESKQERKTEIHNIGNKCEISS